MTSCSGEELDRRRHRRGGTLKGGLGTFAPPLDAAGNSVKGQLVARHLSQSLGLDLLASKPGPATRRLVDAGHLGTGSDRARAWNWSRLRLPDHAGR